MGEGERWGGVRSRGEMGCSSVAGDTVQDKTGQDRTVVVISKGEREGGSEKESANERKRKRESL